MIATSFWEVYGTTNPILHPFLFKIVRAYTLQIAVAFADGMLFHGWQVFSGIWCGWLYSSSLSSRLIYVAAQSLSTPRINTHKYEQSDRCGCHIEGKRLRVVVKNRGDTLVPKKKRDRTHFPKSLKNFAFPISCI
ncbi:hypothetical protein EJ08DRAFT_35956 [Tothia fuscella]|uniref:Uncharacterized protein n=1 Tax=Tothia fuscella TaxID=1048955 RepID=A0A9P4TSB1_9PEZI|nr:hypothetical protein EJ08DRAFT_35956 [Tothia fuscella]